MSHCLSDGKIQEMHWRPSSQSASVCLGGIPVGEKGGGGAVKVWGDQSDVDMCVYSQSCHPSWLKCKRVHSTNTLIHMLHHRDTSYI